MSVISALLQSATLMRLQHDDNRAKVYKLVADSKTQRGVSIAAMRSLEGFEAYRLCLLVSQCANLRCI